MGISHLALFKPHPNVEIVGVCDSSGYALSVLEKYTGVRTFSKVEKMLDTVKPEAMVIATPSATHVDLVRAALSRGINVFCEKPFTLDPAHAEELTAAAAAKGLVTQVGYHNRFVGAFQEVKRLLDMNAIGAITHIVGEAYGPVVLEPKGSTWRSTKAAGGGCLYDYAAHVINLVNWYAGSPTGVGGTVLNSVFSHEIDDEVSSTMYFAGGKTAQISANWCDESQRKMTTRVTIWGTGGRIFADRQECQVYLRGNEPLPDGFTEGWNVRYGTDLNDPVWFYLRGEEYSAQVDSFIKRIVAGEPAGENDFASAATTDLVLGMMVADAANGPTEAPTASFSPRPQASGRRTGRFWDLRRQLGTSVRRRLAASNQ
jgi:predicted dehydrogenase